MAWTYLIIAGVLEIFWAVGLKLSQGFTRAGWTVATVIAMILSFIALAQAVRTIPLGTAYAVWTGIGAVGAAAAGIILFQEPRTAARLACIALIVAGIAGLKLTAPGG
jgi:quaternary ammonium compound-resistance protein SugE